MFFMFPEGWPGIGLLLLRASSGLFLMIQCFALFSERHELSVLTLAGALFVIGFLLLVGFFTRAVAVVAILFGISSALAWFPNPLATPTSAIFFLVIATAVICLGPGALSLDARLFGRREIVIPRSSSSN